MTTAAANARTADARRDRLCDEREKARRRLVFEEAAVSHGREGAEARLANVRADLGRIDLQIYHLKTGDTL